jgi:hypothetical protein
MPASIFSQSALQQIVKDTLVDVPPDHKIAVVAALDQKGVGVTAHFKRETPGGTWDFRGAYRHDLWSGEDQIGASLMFSKK